jgi:transposase
MIPGVWKTDISCGRCGHKHWDLRGGSWTCTRCGRAMTMDDVSLRSLHGKPGLASDTSKIHTTEQGNR